MAVGLEVTNASGTKIIRYTDRLIRFVATGIVAVNKNSYVDITVSGMGNNDTWGVGLTTPLLSSYYQDWYYTKSTNNLRIGYSASASQPASENINYYIFRV
jgi:hypothetical protein